MLRNPLFLFYSVQLFLLDGFLRIKKVIIPLGYNFQVPDCGEIGIDNHARNMVARRF